MTVTSFYQINLEKDISTPTTAGPAYVSAMLNGDFLIVQDHASHVHTQVFDSTGTGGTLWHQVNFNQLDTMGPTVLLNNGAVVVLSRDADSVSFTIQNYPGDTVLVPTTDLGVTNVDQARVVALSDGNFAVIYTQTLTAKDTDISGRIYNSAGVLQDSFDIDTALSLEDNPTVCSLIGGGFAVAWESANAVRYAVYNDDGTVRTAGQTLATTGTDQKPALVALEDGGFAIAYQTDKFSAGNTDIALARFTSVGVPVYDNALFQTSDSETLPSVSLLSGGLLAIGYTDPNPFSVAQTNLIIVDVATGLSAGGTSIGSSLAAENFASVTTLSDGRIVAINTDANGLISGGIYGLGPHFWTSDLASDVMAGGSGIDVMYGGEGNDSLYGGGDNDSLDGSDGADLFIGGYGDNRIIGGRGPDTVDYRFAFGTVVVNLQLDEASFEADIGGVNTDVLLSIENVLMGAGNDFVFSSDADNFIDGGDGSDFIDGAYGDDTILGGAGRDTIDGAGQNDMLDGGLGNDVLDGAQGNDTLLGGSGRDLMIGAGGADTFDFNLVSDSGLSGKTRDRIEDFNAGGAATAVDRIDLSGIDAIPGGTNNAFTFVTGGFSAAGQINVAQIGLDVVVKVNTSGTSGAEMSILLVGVLATDIAAGDFIL